MKPTIVLVFFMWFPPYLEGWTICYHYLCSSADTVDFWLAQPGGSSNTLVMWLPLTIVLLHFIPQNPGKTAVLSFLPLVAALWCSLYTTTYVLLLLLILALNFVQLHNQSNFVSGLSTASCWYPIILASSSTRTGIVNTTQHTIKDKLLFIFRSS
jgi:hypothetical protein